MGLIRPIRALYGPYGPYKALRGLIRPLRATKRVVILCSGYWDSAFWKFLEP